MIHNSRAILSRNLLELQQDASKAMDQYALIMGEQKVKDPEKILAGMCLAESLADRLSPDCEGSALLYPIFFNLADFYRRSDRPDEALIYFEKTAALGSGSWDPYYYLGILYRDQNLLSKSIEAFENGLPANSGMIVGKSNLLFQLGYSMQLHLPNDEQTEIANIFLSALYENDFKLITEKTETLFQLGEISREDGSWKEAEDYYALALDIQPGHYFSKLGLAKVKWNQGEEEEAVSLYIEAIEEYPDRKWAYRELGMFYDTINKLDLAYEMYQSVIEIDPVDDLALNRIKVIEDTIGK